MDKQVLEKHLLSLVPKVQDSLVYYLERNERKKHHAVWAGIFRLQSVHHVFKRSAQYKLCLSDNSHELPKRSFWGSILNKIVKHIKGLWVKQMFNV